MSCLYPLDGWRSKKVNESGKRSIVFRAADGYSDMPLQVPCGKCIGCMADRSRDWSIRMYHEAQCHEQNAFLTLTYQDPPPESISRDHLQRFFKRLRKLYRLRYFACGEYGERTHRPHYHSIIFGQDFLGGAEKINDKFYVNPHIEKIWGYGHVVVSPVNMQTIAYTAGYCTKKIGNTDTFNIMSSRPAIGRQYLDKYHNDFTRIKSAVVEGKELPVPNKYIDWDERLEPVKIEKQRYMRNQTPEQIWNKSTSLRAREENLQGRISRKQEKL